MIAHLLFWADNQFRLEKHVNDRGITQAKALRQIEKSMGKSPNNRTVTSLPSCMTHVWDWFVALLPSYGAKLPTSGGWRQDVAALFGIDPKPWEIQALVSLSVLWNNNQS